MQNIIGWGLFAGLILILFIKIIISAVKKLKPKKSMASQLHTQLNKPAEDVYNKIKENTKEDKMEDNEESDEETYSYNFTCDNCNEENSWDIPTGTRAIDFIKKAKCETCECLVLDEEASKFNDENQTGEE